LSERIAIYIPSLRGGGAERVIVGLANAFADAGHKVDLVLVRAEGPYIDQVAENVRVVDLGASRVALSLPMLVQYLRRERPAAMLSALGHANVIAVVARNMARVPLRLVVSEHSTVSVAEKSAKSVPARVVKVMRKLAYSYADVVVAVSQGVADDLVDSTGVPRDRVHVIYNPVVTPTLVEMCQQSIDDPWFGPSSPPVILGAGRLTLAKDFENLIRAFAQVRSKRACRLMILGEGELRQELEKLASDLGVRSDLAMPGFVVNPYAYMKRASVFVLSSRWEGLPSVLIEALACGCSVVSTDCPSGPAEILEGGRWGRLVPPGDPDALASEILAALIETPSDDFDIRSYTAGVSAERYIALLLGQS